MKHVPLFIRVAPIYVAIGVLAYLPFWQQQQHKKVVLHNANLAAAEFKHPPKHKELISGVPVRILIPSVGIDLPVVNGVYDKQTKTWSVANSTANYATITSPLNNDKGGTLIYGHALDWVFGKTTDLKKGDVVFVYTKNKHLFKYRFTGKSVVPPSDTGIFQDLKHGPELVLLSCDGLWSQNRRLMSFKLQAAT